MNRSTFSPGFRLSLFDVLILVVGLIGAVVLGLQIWWAGMIVGFVVLHFFLFCNVFRISRPPELIWAMAFVGLAGSTIATEVPGWIATVAIALLLSSVLIWRETKREDYHGICWKRWNPKLPDWWKSHKLATNDVLATSSVLATDATKAMVGNWGSDGESGLIITLDDDRVIISAPPNDTWHMEIHGTKIVGDSIHFVQKNYLHSEDAHPFNGVDCQSVVELVNDDTLKLRVTTEHSKEPVAEMLTRLK